MTDHYSQQRSHTEQLNEVINNLRDKANALTVERDNYKRVAEAAMSVSGKVKKVASELGYQESMECPELDYIIELARATVMVNDRNLELTKKIIELTPDLDKALDEEWRRRI